MPPPSWLGPMQPAGRKREKLVWKSCAEPANDLVAMLSREAAHVFEVGRQPKAGTCADDVLGDWNLSRFGGCDRTTRRHHKRLSRSTMRMGSPRLSFRVAIKPAS